METITYKDLNVHQKINAKGNMLIGSGAKYYIGKMMKNAKKDHIWGTTSKLHLRDESENNNRNYDGPGDDYYSGYYGGDWGSYVDEHRMLEAQKLK
jgi:hypothetical protein